MATTTETEQERDALIERLMGATAGMFDVFTTYLGDRLGLSRSVSTSACPAGRW